MQKMCSEQTHLSAGTSGVSTKFAGRLASHTDAEQRYIKLPITGHTATQLTVTAPASGTIAPPGFYMLFIVDNNGIPSEAAWIQITP